jgi:tetratricopeptide (TPR) repeat protein
MIAMAVRLHTVSACFPAIVLACLLVSGCGFSAANYNMQGKRLFEQGQFAQAIDMFQRSANADPQNADAYYNMAATWYYMGKQQNNKVWIQQADQLYRQALVLNPNHAEAYRGLSALMVENGRSMEAFQLVQDWRVKQPGSADPVIELARMYRESGDRGAASQLLVDALHVDSDNARALKAMGQMREEEGQYNLALQNYIRSYQANNMQPDVAQKIASLQGVVRSAQTVPYQPGQNRVGDVNHYVPR